LIRDEDEALYKALLAEVEQMIEPKNILDQMDVRDITDKIWEGQRYKRLQPKLIESECVSALAHILMPTFDLDHEKAFEAANMYYGNNALRRKTAAAHMALYYITDDMVLAKALAQSGRGIGTIDRLIAAREKSRNSLFKDHQRRGEYAAKRATPTKQKTKERTADVAYVVELGTSLPAKGPARHGN
jgi:hypothetical protein